MTHVWRWMDVGEKGCQSQRVDVNYRLIPAKLAGRWSLVDLSYPVYLFVLGR